MAQSNPDRTDSSAPPSPGNDVDAEAEQFHTASEVYVNKISIRTPPFCKDRPALWFASLEAQFFINKITSQTTKFNYAVSLLDTNCTREVEDIIISPPGHTPYQILKDAIISRFSESYEEKIRRLLEKELMGDRKPSSFLRHLKSLAGPNFPDDLLKSIWSSRLPRHLQIVLAAQRLQKLGELAELADTLMEIQSQPPEVCAAGSSQAPSSEQSSLLALQKQVAELTLTVASLTAPGTQFRGRFRDRSSSRNRNRSYSRPRNDQLCWYHDRFGAKAERCIKPCAFIESGNPTSGR